MPVVTNITELEKIRLQYFPTLNTNNNRSQQAEGGGDGGRSKFRVPKIIHQTYKTVDIPEIWLASRNSWIKHHSDCNYILWTDVMLKELIQNYYSWFLDRYNNYQHNIQRVDVGRTFVLHRYGGVYCDLDLQPKTNIWHLFDGNENIYLVQDSGRYTNMLMASPPNSPFWPKLWQGFKNPRVPWWAGTHHFYIQATTGPLLIDRVAKSYPGTIGLLPASRIQPCTACDTKPCTSDEAYFIMLQGGSWNKLDTKIVKIIACHWDWLIIIVIVIIAIILLVWWS